MRVWGVRLLLALGVAVLPHALASAPPATHAPASYEGIDPLLQSAILLHGCEGSPFAMAHWNAPFFHPSPLSLTFMDPLAGQALSIRWLPGAAAHVSWLYFAAFALTLALAFLCTVLLARALGLREWQALAAGTAYVLSPYAAAHFHHLNQLPSPWIPLALLGLLRLRRAQGGGALLLLLALLAQLGYGLYGLASQLLLVLPLAVFTWMRAGRRDRVRLAMALAAFGILLWSYSAPYRAASEQLEGFGRAVEESGPYAARVFDLWHGPKSHLLPWPAWIPGRGVIYPGWGLVLLSAIALWMGRRRLQDRGWITVALAAAGFGVVLAFGRSAPFPFLQGEPSLPFAWLQDTLWPLRALRAPYRFFQPVTLVLALLAPVGAALWWARASGTTRILAVVVFALSVADAAPGSLDRVRLAPTRAERDLMDHLAGEPSWPWALLPQPCSEQGERSLDARAMIWAVRSRAPLAGGSSGFVPAAHASMRMRCCAGANLGCLQALRDLGVRRIVSREGMDGLEDLRLEGSFGDYRCYELLP